jgi:hypothetical protein
VVINAVVEVNEEVCDLGGEVLDVEKISPLRTQIVTGRVTHWNQNNDGVVDQNVYFTQDSCEPGYIPHLGDKVVVKAIESQQGILTWRALSTVPAVSGSQDLQLSVKTLDQLEILLEEKKGITITKCLDFGVLNMGENKELVAEVTNTGLCRHYFVRGTFHSRCSGTQFSLHHPRDGELDVIRPGQTVKFHFGCKGRYIGSSSELFVFTFRGFKIGRNLQVEVQDPLHKFIVPLQNERKFNHDSSWQKGLQARNKGMLISGVKPIKAPAFVPVRLGSFPVPDRLWQAVIGNGERRRIEDVEVAIRNVAPYLFSNLNISNYSEYFHSLLYLEEIEAVLNMQKFDLERVCFRIAGPNKEFLALEVPGLAERRPSLLRGDRVIASGVVPQESAGVYYNIV